MQAGTNKLLIVWGIVFLILASSCNNDSRFYPNISKEDSIHIKINRFDKDFYKMDPSKSDDIELIRKKYGEFFTIYNSLIMGFGNPDTYIFTDTVHSNVYANYDSSYIEEFNYFMTDTVYSKVYAEVLKLFPDMNNEEQELTLAFKRYHYYFPEGIIPKVYTHVSGFNNPIVCRDSILSASLENYLGSDHPFYELLGLYKYQLIHRNRNRIVPDYIMGFLMTNFPPPVSNDRLIDKIIYEGKIYFLMSLLLPEVKDNVLYAFTTEQMQWCKENIEGMWIFITEHKHLFSDDRLLCSKYINNAPNTAWFNPESPPRAAVWLGAQIIEQFIRNNKEISIRDLMSINDAQELLKRSGFRP